MQQRALGYGHAVHRLVLLLTLPTWLRSGSTVVNQQKISHDLHNRFFISTNSNREDIQQKLEWHLTVGRLGSPQAGLEVPVTASNRCADSGAGNSRNRRVISATQQSKNSIQRLSLPVVSRSHSCSHRVNRTTARSLCRRKGSCIPCSCCCCTSPHDWQPQNVVLLQNRIYGNHTSVGLVNGKTLIVWIKFTCENHSWWKGWSWTHTLLQNLPWLGLWFDKEEDGILNCLCGELRANCGAYMTRAAHCETRWEAESPGTTTPFGRDSHQKYFYV